MLRILMIPVFVILALMNVPAAQYAAVGVFVLASITDALDGHIARKTGWLRISENSSTRLRTSCW